MSTPVNGLFVGVFEISALCAMATAGFVIGWHRRMQTHDVATRAASQRLALDLGRALVGHGDPTHAIRTARGARNSVFWSAMELIAEGISDQDLSSLPAEFWHLPPIERELDRLVRGTSWRRALAARRLGLLANPAFRPALARAMERGPTVVTLFAALSLARIGDRSTVRWLLAHPRATVNVPRRMLLAVLKSFGLEAENELIATIEHGPATDPIHAAAIAVLGVWGSRRARQGIERRLAHGGPEIRVAAARALGQIQDAESADPLMKALQDPAWEVRAQAAKALGQMGDRRAIPGLAAAMCDRAWWVRHHAAYALSTMGRTGEAALKSVTTGTDTYAREMAEEALQAMAWECGNPWGASHVG